MNAPELPPRSSALLRRAFGMYSRRYVRSRFHALRVLLGRMPPCGIEGPLALYLNHAAWWDPLVCLRLAQEFFPARPPYAPIDAAMLERYRFFGRIGMFGVEPGTHRGAVQFLRVSRAVLASRGSLWLTPQGRFADARERAAGLAGGLGALAARTPATFVPLAIEYTFWTEPRPEILVAFGQPIDTAAEPELGRHAWTSRFEHALQGEQETLAAAAIRRKEGEWLTLDRRDAGVGGVYDWWGRLGALARGRRYIAGHHPGGAR